MPIVRFTDPASLGLAYTLFSLTTAVDEGRLNEHVPALVTDSWRDRLELVGYYPPTDLRPDVICVQTPSKFVVFMGGVRRIAHINLVMSSIMDPLWRDNASPYLTYAALAASSILGSISQDFQVGRRQLTIGGHSYGGGIANVMFLMLRSTGIGAGRLVVTFGAPRTIKVRDTGAFTRANSCMWQNYRDPVPFVMPTSPEASFARQLYGPVAAGLADSFTTPRTYRILYPDTGGVSLADAPTEPIVTPLIGVLNWAVTSERFTTPTHSRTAYEASLRRVGLLHPEERLSASGGDPSPGVPWGGGNTGGHTWPTTLPSFNYVQGMVLTAPQSPASSDALVRGRHRRSVRQDIVVDGVVVGQDRRASVRRRIRLRAKSLKALVAKADQLDVKALAAIVTSW